MKAQLAKVFLLATLVVLSNSVNAALYSSTLCHQAGYKCYKVKRHDSWASLFPDENEREVVKKINRMNTPIYAGRMIALPASGVGDQMEYSPFPTQLENPPGEKVIIVEISKLAFGAYNEDGVLQLWGPVSTAKGYCGDLGRGCHTPVGTFAIYSKEGAGCKSTKFPIGRGGAPMPYCMFFHNGFALHGSPGEVPGYNASHGCVRMFVEDARWLNEEFSEGSHVKVIIRR